MKLLELLDSGPSAHTLLSRFAKELVNKGFEAEVKSNSKPGIINRSKLCIAVKGYGLNDVIKLYRPLFSWEDKGTYFVDAKHEKKFRTVQELVDALKDKYKRLPKCLEYVPPEVKESVHRPTTRSRVLHLQQELIAKYAEVSDVIHDRVATSDDALFDQYVLIADPVSKDSPHYEHYRRVVVIVSDYATVLHRSVSDEPACGVQVWGTDKPYDWLVEQDWESYHLSRLNAVLQFSAEDATTGRAECIEDAIAELTK